jgi:hypothetical protein
MMLLIIRKLMKFLIICELISQSSISMILAQDQRREMAVPGV